MILAEQPPAPAMIAIVVMTVAILLVFGFGALLLFRGFENSASRALERKYRDLVIHPVPQPGDVLLEFHTYHGLIAWFTQTGHRVYLGPDDARTLLGRLLRFNLTWGLVTPGSLFIPPLSIMNYWAQRRSITAQEVSGGYRGNAPALGLAASVNVLPPTNAINIESPTPLQRFLGWVLMAFSGIFVISAVVNLATGEIEAAMGVFVVAMLFGWFARDWLRNPHSGES